MSKSKWAIGIVSVLAVMTLAGCGNSKSASTKTTKPTLPTSYSSKKKAISGGTLKVAEVNSSAFKGIWDDALTSNAEDTDVMQFGNEALFKYDKNFKYIKGGAADLSLNQKAKTATIKINPKVKWSDGKSLVAQDVAYAYKVLANKATQSEYYTGSIQNIVGIQAYHSGKAKDISGVQIKNKHTVVIHFKQMKPGMKTSGNGYIWENAEPYHYIKNISFSKLASSPQVRKHPLFYGPYKMSKVVSGESVEFTRNKYYYGGTPKLKKITVQVVSADSIAAAIKAHKYDLAIGGVPSSQYKKIKQVSGYTMTGKNALAYDYLGFNLGKYDAKTGKNVMNKNSKMANPSLRKAIAYAMNIDAVEKKFSNGLGSRLTTLIPPVFSQYHDKSAKGFPLNLKKANALLNKAGYKKGKDGYRTDPKGKKLTIHLAEMEGNANTQAIVQNYIQQWKKIGLRVKLTNGRLLDMNNFYEKVQANSSDIDMFEAAWSLSSEPSPADLFNENAPYNMGRFVTKENTKLLNNIDSQKAFNTNYRVKAFKKWQEYMNKEAAYVPENTVLNWYPVNNRVKNFYLTGNSTVANGLQTNWSKVQVTSNSLSK
ncbi:peptide ABC transporter substrate-binding protein [Pediococcus damnosus LMG 28219]|uniref:oligopeptide ABC transporter substrate-binding protein n=1 Tax=Pediococcus damnosus TaxID=51663 RepID=UPI00061F8AD6|nr:oligopeptide ABC transporter substrate-binding protein [Pediococcus damnosus]KJU74372.1 peptide ABC transporter substrate-binding protein [Pediococcus damnosus LMG 28219]PIO80633.1 oligopeptide ABC transporter substrate-binding protein [Pediococcus damnosus]PIO85797.1 oligopeptide ABC transporter substrate-binding protein [Pediococcus damnosus]